MRRAPPRQSNMYLEYEAEAYEMPQVNSMLEPVNSYSSSFTDYAIVVILEIIMVAPITCSSCSDCYGVFTRLGFRSFIFTMLAISTTDALSVLDSITIKRSPASVPSCLALIHKPIASTWSSDKAFLFLTSAQTIHRYDPSSSSLKDFYYTNEEVSISAVVSKDKGTLIFCAGENVHVLDCGLTPKISQTFDSHKSPITSLSLSNDASLLASTSIAAVHVHNLTLGSYTVLRGLPSPGQEISTCVFHPQLRTRLLLGIGKQLVVYDTTRPSSPMKTVALSETSSGDITVVACSPFSKTLVAVATTCGSVGLVDLEKEKG